MRRSVSHQSASTRRGAVAILVAISMLALLGVLALAVESGRTFDVQRRLQMAADSAALAAATEMYRSVAPTDDPTPVGNPVSIAYDFAADNGYRNAAPNVVTVSTPPHSGAFAGRNGFVQVEIQTKVKRAFSAVFGQGDLVISADSVAGGTTIPSKASILILEPKKNKVLNLKGDSAQLISNSDIFVNSRGKSAVTLDKKAQLSASALMVAGGMDRKSKRSFSGDLFTGVQPTPDPFASLPAPAISKAVLNAADYRVAGAVAGSYIYNLPPGTYKDLSFAHNDIVKLQPGTFELTGSFNIRDKATMTGTGVTLYYGGKHDMQFNTSGAVSLTPPTTGPYAGITIFVNRKSTKNLVFRKDADYNIEGVIYAPNSNVKFQHTDAILAGVDEPEGDEPDLGGGDTTGTIKASLVAKTLTVDKHSILNINGSALNVQRPFLGLIE